MAKKQKKRIWIEGKEGQHWEEQEESVMVMMMLQPEERKTKD